MANNQNLKPFKKGKPGGPGRPKNPPELSEIKRMTKGEFELLMQKLIHLEPAQLSSFKGTVLEMAMASIIQQSIKQGDQNKLQFFIERLFGKVTDKVEITDKTSRADALKSARERDK